MIHVAKPGKVAKSETGSEHHSPRGVSGPVPVILMLLLRFACNSLAGVSRSTTILVAYLMTVTNLGWEECLAATKAVRSYVCPNFGFQQQLQEYERTSLQEVWLRSPSRPSPRVPTVRAPTAAV